MNRRTYIIVLLLFAVVALGGFSYAGSGSGMGSGSGSGGMGSGSGSGDHGMMGGQSHGMMDTGQNYSNSRR
jgi:hypothetical protein